MGIQIAASQLPPTSVLYRRTYFELPLAAAGRTGGKVLAVLDAAVYFTFVTALGSAVEVVEEAVRQLQNCSLGAIDTPAWDSIVIAPAVRSLSMNAPAINGPIG